VIAGGGTTTVLKLVSENLLLLFEFERDGFLGNPIMNRRVQMGEQEKRDLKMDWK
jgi:hypothetical protein